MTEKIWFCCSTLQIVELLTLFPFSYKISIPVESVIVKLIEVGAHN